MFASVLNNDKYYCEHLTTSEKNLQDIQNFSVKHANGEGLANYVKNSALYDEADGVMRTYFVRDNVSHELVGYFSLKAGLVSLNEGNSGRVADFDTLPGVEVANFAVNNSYCQKHSAAKGIGFIIFADFIKPLIKKAAELVGVKVIYIFALPFEELISHYEKYGFRRLNSQSEIELHKRLKPRYDSECIFMFIML